MKKALSFIFEVVKIIIIALVIVVPIRYFLFQPFFVRGESMIPNFENNDYLIVDEISYKFKAPKRGEVIVFKYPKNPSQRYIKRIIGLPGETVEVKGGKVEISKSDSNFFILDESGYLSEYLKTAGDLRVSLAEDEYFVLGDNRQFSYDSRRWGTLPKKNIIGKVLFRAWPVTAAAEIKAPSYGY